MQRSWFDVAKALHEHLGIKLGTAAYVVAWFRYGWCMLTTRKLPPQWLFSVGSCCGWLITWVRMIATWFSVQWLRFQIWLLRWQGKRKGFDMDREEFKHRCVFWSQIATGVALTDQFPPGGCDRLGSLSGRLIRYSRTFDPANAYEREMAEDAAFQVEREFTKLPQVNQEMMWMTMKGAAKMGDGKVGFDFLAAIEREEKRIRGKHDKAN
jgi:hypothetical protein